MKLYSYDHCPYCVKARMIFGLKNISFELITLLNDDEETPISMIGQKMLPILEKSPGEYMPESLDIVSYIDNLNSSPVVGSSKEDPLLNQWLQEMRQFHYPLAMPRWPQMGLDEFATKSAQNYFTKKKEQMIGAFSENLEKSEEFINGAHKHLQKLEEFMVASPYLWGENISVDDFHLFASLRCLTTTKGIGFSDKVNTYVEHLSQVTKVPLHWGMAL